MGYFWAALLGMSNPYVYLEDGKVVPVDKSELPIELPNEIDLNAKGNPLDSHVIGNLQLKSLLVKAVRETDILDTFVDSS